MYVQIYINYKDIKILNFFLRVHAFYEIEMCSRFARGLVTIELDLDLLMLIRSIVAHTCL